QRGNRSTVVHGLEQSVLERRPLGSHAEPAGGHFSIRTISLQGLAGARLDRRTDHHVYRALALDRGAGAYRETTFMSVTSLAAAAAHSQPGASPGVAHLPQKISIRGLNFYYGAARALKDITLSLYQNKVTAFIGP